jgi:hypothetical protein
LRILFHWCWFWFFVSFVCVQNLEAMSIGTWLRIVYLRCWMNSNGRWV